MTIDQGLARRIVATARSRTNFRYPKNRGPHGAGLLQQGLERLGRAAGKMPGDNTPDRRVAFLRRRGGCSTRERGTHFCRKPLGQHSLLAA